MNLYDRLKADNQRIISGNDMQTVTLYNASGAFHSGNARVTSVGMDINSQGQMFATKKHSIAFHISDFLTIMSASETFIGWKATFLNSQNETITGYFNNQLVDKTLDYVSATLTPKKAAS
jgi:hypothetical protein